MTSMCLKVSPYLFKSQFPHLQNVLLDLNQSPGRCSDEITLDGIANRHIV